MIRTDEILDAYSIIHENVSDSFAEVEGLYDIYYNIATAILDYRKDNGLSQKDLASVLGVSQAMVSKLESGDYNYSVEQLWKISRKLGMDLEIHLERKCYFCDEHKSDQTINEAIQKNVKALALAG